MIISHINRPIAFVKFKHFFLIIKNYYEKNSLRSIKYELTIILYFIPNHIWCIEKDPFNLHRTALFLHDTINMKWSIFLNMMLEILIKSVGDVIKVITNNIISP